MAVPMLLHGSETSVNKNKNVSKTRSGEIVFLKNAEGIKTKLETKV
jgi:hypothetical protein